ncbi:hypothetical protein LIER_38863 [Lithospermum erythrorhizon]|uniref:Transposon Ty3-I Gag-Pol polyprotein n=1 Tax=Lithospermum erythrorhizon TaxID=34254 RepID=A0AAV3Q8A1_LITER
MPGVDPGVSVHRFYVDPHYKPIKQKKRTFSEEKGEAIREEVDELLGANAIGELLFPTWLANVVLIPKPNGTWRICTDYTSINMACPKDCYPLPNIDRLVDSSDGYKVVDFMDEFWGYHQIIMVEEDVEKTVFVTEHGYVESKDPEGRSSLTGRIEALSRFISRARDRRLPFFKAIKKGKLVCAFIVAARKLKPYIEAHPVEALADFMVECTRGLEEEAPEVVNVI